MEKGKETLAQGKHLRFVKKGADEYVERIGVKGVVVVIAIDAERRLLLIEQQRTALGRSIIELPGGMAGDEDAAETLEQAARRELMEETGYAADEIRLLGDGPSSAGLTSEMITFYLAQPAYPHSEMRQEDKEKSILHHVEINRLNEWLACQVSKGIAIDYRIYAGLYMAKHI